MSDGNFELWYWLSPFFAFLISAMTSMGGVSGAFLLLPFQMTVLGITSPSVSATNQLYNVLAIPGGVYRYFKEGRMVWPLTWMIAAGSLPGVIIGAVVRLRYLADTKRFTLFAAFVLLFVGARITLALLRTSAKVDAEAKFHSVVRQRQQGNLEPAPDSRLSTRVIEFHWSHLLYEFQGTRHRVSCVGVVALSLVVGIVGGIYGIGGGAIIAPFLVSIFGLPVYTTAGAALMGTFLTSTVGVVVYRAAAPFYPHLQTAPDWTLGVLLGAGGAVGMYVGARCQKRVPAGIIKWMLAIVVLTVSGRFLWAGFSAS